MSASAALLEKNQVAQQKTKSSHGGPRPNSGRPKGSVSEETKRLKEAEATLKELATQHVPEAVSILAKMFKDEGTPAAARVAAIKEIMDRAYGKAPQAVELSGNAENPLSIISRIELVAPSA
jgi:hypothetical protein